MIGAARVRIHPAYLHPDVDIDQSTTHILKVWILVISSILLAPEPFNGFEPKEQDRHLSSAILAPSVSKK